MGRVCSVVGNSMLNQTAAHLDEFCFETDSLCIVERALKGIGNGVSTRENESLLHLCLPGMGRSDTSHSNWCGGIENAGDG